MEVRSTRIHSVVLRQIGGRGHFRSRDKDGSHTIRSAVAEKPHAIRKLHDFIFYRTGVIEVLHCGNREFRVFCEKIVEIILKRRSCRGNTSLRYKTRKSVKWCDLYR